LAIGLLATTPLAAGAVDGAIQLNQARAIRGGLSASDVPGFPITLDAPGHYVLTSDLEVSDPDAGGILVATSNVSIDLNGFRIWCAACGGVVGSGKGITRSVFGIEDTTVRNGTVHLFGSDGIALTGDRTRIAGVRAIANGGHGIHVGQSARVDRSIAFLNGADGIRASSHAAVSDSIVARNGSNGVRTTIGAAVRRTLALQNARHGIETDQGSSVSGNVAALNDVDGFFATEATITNNAAVQNVGAGFSAEHSTVVTNTSTSNGIGLDARLSRTGYARNVFGGNNAMGAQVSFGLPLDLNVCEEDTQCP